MQRHEMIDAKRIPQRLSTDAIQFILPNRITGHETSNSPKKISERPGFGTGSMPDFGKGQSGGTQRLLDRTHCDCRSKFPGVGPVGAPLQRRHRPVPGVRFGWKADVSWPQNRTISRIQQLTPEPTPKRHPMSPWQYRRSPQKSSLTPAVGQHQGERHFKP